MIAPEAPIVHGLVHYEETSLVIDDRLDLEQWLFVARSLGAMARNVQWWVGDALVYAERRFGEEAFFQAAEELGVEPHTLTNWRWVAAAVAPDRRAERLTWSHHAEVARLGPAAQRACLATAESEGWTVRQLRDHVTMRYPQSQPQLFEGDDGGGSPRAESDLQKRLEEIDLRWQDVAPDKWRHWPRMTEQHVDDVRFLLGVAKSATRGGA